MIITYAVFQGWDWLYGKVWIWLSKDEIDPARTIRDVVLALAAPVGIMLAVWRSKIAEAGLLHERYQRNAEMLGNPDFCSVRLGGIHALANLANEHRSTYHPQTMQLFAAFVVERTNADSKLKRVEPSPDSLVDSDTERANGPKADEDTHEFEQITRESWSEGSDIPDFAEDVRESMRLIAGRDRRQVALERRRGLQLNLSGAVLVRLVLLHPIANLSNIDFSDANLSRARLWQARFSGTILAGARLIGASLMKANLCKVDMRGADLTNARLTDANLLQADLGPRNRVGEWATSWKDRVTKLRGAWLEGVDMRGANLDRADLQWARLGGANLDNSNLSGADARRADLKAAVLYKANLSGANLSGANFGGLGADLCWANLTGANLTGANLSLAVLTGTDFTDANLSSAEFSNNHREKHFPSSGEVRPATGLTQDQLDGAKADPDNPPYLEGVLDSITKRPLVWRGQPIHDS